MATWAESVTDLIDILQGGAVRRLCESADAVPSGAEAIAAWDALEERLDLRRALDPVAKAGTFFGEPLDGRNDALAKLVWRLADAVDRALDEGHQSQDDPIIREKDASGIIRIGSGTHAGWRCAKIDGHGRWPDPIIPPLPDNHVLRTFPPFMLGDGSPVVLLCPGSTPKRFYRLSVIRRLTSEAVDQQRHEQLEGERVKAAEAERRAELARQLERQAAALRGGLIERAGP